MGQRTQRVLAEVLKFASVSGFAALVSFGLFNLLVHGPGRLMHAHALTAYFIANTIGMVVSYAGTRKYAFSHRETRGPAGGAVNYFLINTLSLGIPMACLWFTRNALHQSGVLVDNLSANVVGSTLATVVRYFAFKRFVFKKPLRRHPVVPHHLAVPSASGVAAPEVGPPEAELVEHQPEQGDADPDHVVRVAGHPADER
jgi:putative flippase GtrA